MLTLHNTMGDPQLDLMVRGVLDAIDRAQPNCVHAVYLEGSRSDNTYVAGSDVDLMIVLHRPLAPPARRLADEASAAVLDIDFVDQASLAGGITPQLQRALLLCGDDLRQNYPLIPIDRWTLERMKTSYWRLAKLFQRRVPLSRPLTYPDKSDEFFGYVRRTIADGSGNEVLSTRDVLRAVGWAATAIIAFEAREYVASKRDCASTYSRTIGDQWSNFLEQLHRRCRIDWHYQVPQSTAARCELRKLCSETLAFENHFLIKFIEYEREQLRAGRTQAAAELRSLFERVPIVDAEIAQLSQK